MQLRNTLTSLDKLDLSKATLDSIYEIVCDHYGVKILSPDFLSATFASKADCADIDWYAYFDEQRDIRKVLRMSLRQRADLETPTTQADTLALPPFEVNSQGPPQGPSVDVSNARSPALNPLSIPQPIETATPPQKTVRFARSLSPPSPKPRLPCNTASAERLLVHLPTPSLELYGQLEILILDDYSDPIEDICMSGGLHPADTHPALAAPNSITARRLKPMIYQNDATVCSSDLTTQVIYMPDRLISREELAEIWAEEFFIEPDNSTRWLPVYYYTTNAGLLAAKQISNRHLERLVEVRAQRRRQQLGIGEDEELPQHLVEETYPTEEEHDWFRAKALAHFGGEFDYNDGRSVKYPEHLREYPDRLDGVKFGPKHGLVWQYWEELWERADKFWESVCVSPIVEDDEQDLEM